MATLESSVSLQPNPETQVPGVGITPATIKESPIASVTEKIVPVLVAHQKIQRSGADNTLEVADALEQLSAQAQELKERAIADPQNFSRYIQEADRLQVKAMNNLRKMTPIEKWGTLRADVKETVGSEFNFTSERVGNSTVFTDNEGYVFVNPIQKEQGQALVAAKYEQDLQQANPLVALWWSRQDQGTQQQFATSLSDSAKITYENTIKYNLGNSEDQLEALDLHELQRSAPGRQIAFAENVEKSAMPILETLEESVKLGTLAGADVIRAAVYEAFAMPTRSMTDSWKSPVKWESHAWKTHLDAEKFVREAVAEQYVNKLTAMDILHKAKVDADMSDASLKVITNIQKYNEAEKFGKLPVGERLSLRDPYMLTNLSLAVDLYEKEAFRNQVAGIFPVAQDEILNAVSLTLDSRRTLAETDRFAFTGANAEKIEPFAQTAEYINAVVKIAQSKGTLKAPEGFKHMIGLPMVELYKRVMDDPRYDAWAAANPKTAASLVSLKEYMRRYEKTASIRAESMDNPAIQYMLQTSETTMDGLRAKYRK